MENNLNFSTRRNDIIYFFLSFKFQVPGYQPPASKRSLHFSTPSGKSSSSKANEVLNNSFNTSSELLPMESPVSAKNEPCTSRGEIDHNKRRHISQSDEDIEVIAVNNKDHSEDEMLETINTSPDPGKLFLFFFQAYSFLVSNRIIFSVYFLFNHCKQGNKGIKMQDVTEYENMRKRKP